MLGQATSSPRDSDVESAIRRRDVGVIRSLFFPSDEPVVGPGFKTEGELWDYKADCPKPSREDASNWANIAKDVVAFHNNRGGIVFFGIRDSDFLFVGATHRLDSKLANDQLRRYLGDKVWVEFHREFITEKQRYLGIMLIPPRGPMVLRFASDAPLVNGKQMFRKGDSATRKGDESLLLSGRKADVFARKASSPRIGDQYAIDVDYFRILAPEYERFVVRPDPCAQVERALRDPRTSVASIIGIGGMGKTALATWSALKAYEEGLFDLIVSTTAKDRELVSGKIRALDPGLSTFESLLDSIISVVGLEELRKRPVGEKEREIRSLLEGSNSLLYVDNLESVDDARVIEFLDDLPQGVRALTTSRRASVRVAVRPIDLAPLSIGEAREYVRILANAPGLGYTRDLSQAEIERIAGACNGIPLAIQWALTRSGSAAEALRLAEAITQTGKTGEELLEFTFRRVFDAMAGTEKTVLQVLSLFQAPQPIETIVVGGGLPQHRLADALESLIGDALVHRAFSQELNDYSYSLLPITRAFVYSDVCRRADLESQIRRRLADYFEARDISDPRQRTIVRQVRQGRGEDSEASLLDLARSADRRGQLNEAEALYEQALQRSPTSWRAARSFGEFQRHKKENLGEALRLYERAATYAPQKGPERALIYREWGILLRHSGTPDATTKAIEKLEVALFETPNDPVALHSLGHMLKLEGHNVRAMQVLEPLLGHPDSRTRTMAAELLLSIYDQLGEIVKAAEVRAVLGS